MAFPTADERVKFARQFDRLVSTATAATAGHRSPLRAESGTETTGADAGTPATGGADTPAAAGQTPAAATAASETKTEDDIDPTLAMKPKDIVKELDRYIIGQTSAKRAVAIAMRNRWRRHKLPKGWKEEVMPKNMLMIGPTGVGKTEIARRIAKLTNAPFVKVEATKYTEVGFHGRDCDTMIKDLADIAVTLVKSNLRRKHKSDIDKRVHEELLSLLVGTTDASSRAAFSQQLTDGLLEGMQIEIEVPLKEGSPEMDGRDKNMQQLMRFLKPQQKDKRRMTIAEARPILAESIMERLIATEDINAHAIKSCEEDGIVFIDEIDKICSKPSDRSSADASAEGVQRDLLPIIEGCTISTKYGNVNTDHILFIASGAFTAVKPSDMLAELQGRLPIRVELKGLTEKDMYRILTETKYNLVAQQRELLKIEGVDLQFTDDAVREIAKVAAEVNQTVENIGARRLNTVIERIMDEISFDAPDMEGSAYVVDAAKVRQKVAELSQKSDLSRYII